jgi:hypothetical protein
LMLVDESKLVELEDGLEELDLIELEVVEDEVVLGGVELCVVGVGVGVGEGLEVDEGTGAWELLLAGEDDDPAEPDPALESPTGKTTTLAVTPWGIVTTQKLAPPAPEA